MAKKRNPGKCEQLQQIIESDFMLNKSIDKEYNYFVKRILPIITVLRKK